MTLQIICVITTIRRTVIMNYYKQHDIRFVARKFLDAAKSFDV
jgi:hypothetical protein